MVTKNSPAYPAELIHRFENPRIRASRFPAIKTLQTNFTAEIPRNVHCEGTRDSFSIVKFPWNMSQAGTVKASPSDFPVFRSSVVGQSALDSRRVQTFRVPYVSRDFRFIDILFCGAGFFCNLYAVLTQTRRDPADRGCWSSTRTSSRGFSSASNVSSTSTSLSPKRTSGRIQRSWRTTFSEQNATVTRRSPRNTLLTRWDYQSQRDG